MYEGLPLLDENEEDQLYRLKNEMFDTVILVCDGEEFALRDMQGTWPETLEEAAEYDWFPLAQIMEYHG